MDLERLPEGWCVYRDGAEWAVGTHGDDDDDGHYVSWLASGATVEDAITAGHARIAQEQREAEERRADFERRKAAGQLTPLEIAGSYIPGIWASEVVKGW